MAASDALQVEVADGLGVDPVLGLESANQASHRGRVLQTKMYIQIKNNVFWHQPPVYVVVCRGQTEGALPIFGATKTSAFSTNAQLRYVSVVLLILRHSLRRNAA